MRTRAVVRGVSYQGGDRPQGIPGVRAVAPGFRGRDPGPNICRAEKGSVTSYFGVFLEFLEGLPNGLIYILLGLSAFVENVFPPVPGDTITAFGAFLVGTRRLSFTGVYVSTVVGSLSGFMSLFWVGGFLGRRFFIERDYRFFKASDIIRAEDWFRRHGYYLVLCNRFLPGIRSVISLVSGITGLRALKTGTLALISICAWNLVWISIGYAVGNNWDTVRSEMDRLMARYNLAILALFSAAVAAMIARGLFNRSRNRKGPDADR